MFILKIKLIIREPDEKLTYMGIEKTGIMLYVKYNGFEAKSVKVYYSYGKRIHSRI